MLVSNAMRRDKRSANCAAAPERALRNLDRPSRVAKIKMAPIGINRSGNRARKRPAITSPRHERPGTLRRKEAIKFWALMSSIFRIDEFKPRPSLNKSEKVTNRADVSWPGPPAPRNREPGEVRFEGPSRRPFHLFL